MLYKQSFFICTIAIALMLAISCPTERSLNDLSENFISFNDTSKALTITSINKATAFIVDTLPTSGALMFGKFRDGVDNVFTLVGYTKFSYSFDDPSKIQRAISSELRLYSGYAPSVEKNITFDIYLLLNKWKASDIKTNSKLELGNKINTETLSISTSSTESYTSYYLPDSYTQALFDAVKNSSSYLSGDSSSIGIAFVPTGETSIIKINSFTSKLAFTFDQETKTNVERRTVLMDLVGTTYSSSQTKQSYSDDLNSGVYISSSTSNRINFIFDITSLPSESHIQHAELTLYTDTLMSKFLTTSNSTYFAALTTTDDLNFSTSNIYAYSQQDTASSGNFLKGKYSFNITSFLQRWVDKPEENKGIQIMPLLSYSEFSLIKFYYQNLPSDSLKPRIDVYFTEIKN